MINKELVKQILVEQNQHFLKREPGTTRLILQNIIIKTSLPHVHVVTGMRRSGKSTLIRQIARYIYNDKSFYYLNFEDERFLNFRVEDFQIIHESLIELFGLNKVFFIDEIQNVAGFEFFVRRLFEQGYKLFLTGSNANLLSQEISSRLTGRHIDTNLQPFSFLEFLDFNNVIVEKNDVFVTERRAILQKKFSEYLTTGGMPEYVKYHDDEILIRIYEDIITKDIAIRYKITNIFQLKQLYQLLISNFSTRFSYHSLVKQTKIQSNLTIQNYIGYLQNTNFGKVVNKFDHSPKKQINSPKKFYLSDHAFIARISTKLTKDYGRILENVVFSALTQNAEVYYFSNKTECDFITIDPSKNISAMQVCYDLNDQNKSREIGGLLEAMQYLDIETGLLLTMSQEDELKSEGKTIRVIPVWKWMVQGFADRLLP